MNTYLQANRLKRGLLTTAGKEIKSKEVTVALLEALKRPKTGVVVHCPGIKRRIPRQREGTVWQPKQPEGQY